MIDALISGKLIKTPELKTGKTGSYYTQFLLSVDVGEEKPVVVSGMAFAEIAERVARLQKGDPLAVVGSLKPSEWIDKATGETKHGLNMTANNSLSPYDIKKRKSAPEQTHVNSGNHTEQFNEPVNF
ncbi:MAG: single-stranded DNA-binding protein [Methylococcaceae bacterium]